MKFLSWLKESSTYFVVFAVAAALPTYLLRFHIGPLPMTVLEAVELMAIAFVIARSFATKRSPRDCFASLAMTIKTNWLLAIGSALILIATIVGIIVSPDKLSALGIAKAYFWEPMALAWLLIMSKPDAERAKRAMLYGFAVSAMIVIVYGLIQYAFPSLIPATWTAERRITSVFDFPNAAALFLAPLVPLFFSIPFGTIISLAAIAVIIFAKSAGGLVAVAASLFFLGILKKRTRIISIIAAAIIASLVFFAPQAAGLREQILLRDWSGRVHMIGWKESLAMLRDRPVFGAGLSGYQTAVLPYHSAQGVEIFQYPHNLFLAAWSETGIMGLTGFVLILVWFFRAAFTPHPALSPLGARGNNIFLIAAMIAILIHGLVDVPYFKNDLSMMFWLFVAIMAL